MTETAEQAKPPAGKSLGRIAARSEPRTLMLSHFLRTAAPPPKRFNFWKNRAPFEPQSWGNRNIGDCTVAKQANMFRRFERIERRRTVEITTEEVERVYYAMTDRHYGGGDTGAYEEDALNLSRSEETCLHDAQGHPLLIDAYARFDPRDFDLLKTGVYISGGHGAAVCINPPRAFQFIDPPEAWEIPEGQQLTGDWEPGSWGGGHSMWWIAYDEDGAWMEHTWDEPAQLITWKAIAAYADEGHTIIDSVDAWRKKRAAERLNLDALVKAVNKVSSTKIGKRKAA